jgi:hypothetical protein
MSKPSRRPTREARKEHKQKRREVQRQLRAARAQGGVVPPARHERLEPLMSLLRLRLKNRRGGKTP